MVLLFFEGGGGGGGGVRPNAAIRFRSINTRAGRAEPTGSLLRGVPPSRLLDSRCRWCVGSFRGRSSERLYGRQEARLHLPSRKSSPAFLPIRCVRSRHRPQHQISYKENSNSTGTASVGGSHSRVTLAAEAAEGPLGEDPPPAISALQISQISYLFSFLIKKRS